MNALKVTAIAAMLAIAASVIISWPDLKRYIKIERM